jgi:hypothetical protein
MSSQLIPLPWLAFRRHTVTMMTMPRELDRRRPGTGSATTTRVLAAVGLIALLGGMLYIVHTARETSDAPSVPARTTAATPPPKPVVKPPARVKVVVTGVGAYDPEGDRSENGGDAHFATDGIPTTAWKTEHYRTTFHKSGVGLVVDAGKPVKATRVVVTTDTPGYAARVQVGNSAAGPFTDVSGSKTTTARTVYILKPRSARYLVLWITSMPAGGVASVNEIGVTAGA